MEIEDFPVDNLEMTIDPGFFLLKKEMMCTREGTAVWVKGLVANKNKVLVGPFSKMEENSLVVSRKLDHQQVPIWSITNLHML